MGTSIVVSSQNFAADVVQRSYQKPVLVDFFATWCGPCQLLKPMLEKLAQEYDFVLAKIDIDQNPDLANTYAVEGVPDVRVVRQGEMSQGFVGVLPEPKLRELLAQLDLKSQLETGLEAVRVAQVAGDTAEVEQLLDRLLSQYPGDRILALEAAQIWIRQAQIDRANSLLSDIGEHEREFFDKAQALKMLIQFKREMDQPTLDSDLDQHYLKGIEFTLQEHYEEALQVFLELVSRDRRYRQDAARKAMIALFNLLGDDHPLTRHYRKQLMLALY
ncbi:MAG: tetratricopeptide repeat protein [Leptolyngbyaceae cyanobacterium SL_7_1]|nr:tetratricopeptide repeat protein [Leptolyngbyaceae cyanobacterium SL_7_1]